MIITWNNKVVSLKTYLAKYYNNIHVRDVYSKITA